MNILVTGGAGYIGSHVVKLLGESGEHTITVVDNLSTGKKEALLYGTLVEMDLGDYEKVDHLFQERHFDAVIHFAAFIVVPESVEKPIQYYKNNTINTTHLIDIASRNGVKYFVFSSTAAVYGEPDISVVDESLPLMPINPYGWSKLMSEQVLRDTCSATEMKHIILRYFNVAGADPDGKIGQNFPQATHLIKVACQTALGMRDKVAIFGTDFDTPDGTGVRDYIHVTDLASAHLASLSFLDTGGESQTLNCGYGTGFSVREVLKEIEKVHGEPFTVIETERRAGDPASLIANNSKILKTLIWKPQYDNLHTICKTAYMWEKRKF
ncbi:UDP-glucose 4-epimerase GalE [bacterium]|nr:UDP-glucose 4-epimerase GalE [bacterium]